MSVCESVQRVSGRSQRVPKRSGYVALALMGTAGFAASFAAGSALLNWKSPVRPAAAAVQQPCTTMADGSQTCPRAESGWRSRIHYYIAWPNGSAESSRRSSSLGSSQFSKAGTVIQRKRSVTVHRGGFGSVARSISVGRISVGG